MALSKKKKKLWLNQWHEFWVSCLSNQWQMGKCSGNLYKYSNFLLFYSLEI